MLLELMLQELLRLRERCVRLYLLLIRELGLKGLRTRRRLERGEELCIL